MKMEITTTSATVNTTFATVNTTSATFSTASNGSAPGFFEGVVISLIRLIALVYMFVAGHWGREHSILPAWAEVITICTLLAIIGGEWSSKLGRLAVPKAKPTLPSIHFLFAALLAVILNTKLREKRLRRNKDRGEDESASNSSTQEDHIYQQPLLSDIFLPGGHIEL